MQLAVGATFGTYRIDGILGHGGMASVYRAFDPGLDRFVALKVLLPQFLSDPAFAARFVREAKSTAALEHPHIVPLYASGIESGVPWIAMRLVTGGTLSDVTRKGPLALPAALPILSGVAAALDYAHASGFVHRDVTSHNILLDEGGHPYLADFGIARIVGGAATITSGIIGTPQYMAPEQARGEAVDHRADIYAFGVVTFETLTGRVPFTADTPAAILVKHILEPVPTPSAAEVAAPVFEPVRRCLAKKPDDRWPSASAFVAALEEALERRGAGPDRVGPPPPGPGATATVRSGRAAVTLPVGRPRWGVYLAGAGAMAAAGFAAIALMKGPAPKPGPVAASAPTVVSPPGPSPPTAAVGTVFAPVTSPARPPEPTPNASARIEPARPPSSAVSPTPAPTAPIEARVSVQGVPGSVLTVDGVGGRMLPAELSLVPGRHQLVVRKIGCRSTGQSVELLAGEVREIRLEPECGAPGSEPFPPTPAAPAAILPAVTPSLERMPPGGRRLAYLVGDWVIEGRFLRGEGEPGHGRGYCKWIGMSQVMCRTEWSERQPSWMVAAYDDTTGGYWFSADGGPRQKFQLQGPTWIFEVEGKREGKSRQRTTMVETGPSTADVRIEISWDRKAWHPFFEGVQRRR